MHASSVSSEHVFSQGGITITKRRNRLKGDIVEALQCIKCAIRHDLLFREPAPSSILEGDITSDNEQENVSTGRDLAAGSDDESEIEEFSWDGLLIEDEDDKTSMYCSE
jgi:hypothetical protein